MNSRQFIKSYVQCIQHVDYVDGSTFGTDVGEGDYIAEKDRHHLVLACTLEYTMTCEHVFLFHLYSHKSFHEIVIPRKKSTTFVTRGNVYRQSTWRHQNHSACYRTTLIAPVIFRTLSNTAPKQNVLTFKLEIDWNWLPVFIASSDMA